jgi:import inner membrane translocase subunit TIM50
VLDLEKTLIGSEYDARYGWRHVKRPGLDQFIARLCQYYEIVILSENDVGTVQDILVAIDGEGRCHKFGSAACEARDGVMLKRLDLMNRDISRIILIDDDPEASKLFPDNTLQIKPFTDVRDKNDTVLFDLVPLLQAFVHDGAADFRTTLDDLGTHEAEEAVIEYRMRLSEKKAAEERKRNKGIGGVVRSRIAPSSTGDVPESRSGVLSVSQIVGEAPPEGASPADLSSTPSATGKPGSKETPKPPAQKKKGALFDWLDNAEKEREEYEMRRREKMNEIYANRMREKMQKEQQEAEEKRRAAARLD